MTITADRPARLRAHLLLQVDPDRMGDLRDYLAAVPGVVTVAATTGAFDAVLEVDVDGEVGLQRVQRAVRRAPGLARLRLCRSGSPSCDDVEPGQAFYDWAPWSSAMAANA